MEKGEEETTEENKKNLDIDNKNPLKELQAICELSLINTYNADLLEIEIIEVYSGEEK